MAPPKLSEEAGSDRYQQGATDFFSECREGGPATERNERPQTAYRGLCQAGEQWSRARLPSETERQPPRL